MNTATKNPASHKWLTLSALVVVMLVLNIDGTAVNLSIVPISREMHAGLGVLQWILSGYGLAWSIFVVIAGRLSDTYGTKPLLIIGSLIFMTFSIVCALSGEVWLLIVGRLFQGIGAAICLPTLYTIIYQSFQVGHRGTAVGLLGMGSGVGSAVGPTIGGVIIEYLDWHWIYYINIPFCLFVVVIIFFTVKPAPAKKKNESKGSLDLLASAYLAIAVAALIYGFNNIQVWGIFDYKIIGLFAIAIIGGVLLHFQDKKSASPLIPAGALRNKTFTTCLLGYGIIEYIFGAVVVITGLYLQSILGFSAFKTGLLFLSFATLLAVTAPLGGKVGDDMDPRIPATLGLILGTIGLICMLFFEMQTSQTFLLIGLGFVGCVGLCMGPYNNEMLKSIPPKSVGTLSGLFNMGAGIGFSLGIVLSTSILMGVSKWKMAQQLDHMHFTLSEKSKAILDTLLSSAHRDYNLLKQIPEVSEETLIHFLDQAFLSGFKGCIYLTIACAAIGAVLTLLWLKIPKVATVAKP